MPKSSHALEFCIDYWPHGLYMQQPEYTWQLSKVNIKKGIYTCILYSI